MKVELEGKVAVVTGGANGIGRSTVDALIGNGAQVAIVDIDTQAGMKTVEEVKEMGGDLSVCGRQTSQTQHKWRMLRLGLRRILAK